MNTTEKSTKDVLVEKGFKYEDVARVSGQMFSYAQYIRMIEKAVVYGDNTGVRGRGNEHADILIVSDEPEESEMNTNIVGFSDYALYLTVLLNRLDIDFGDVYWTTAIKKPNQRINMKLIKEDFQILKNEITFVAPFVIIALGTTAISSLAGEPIKIDKAIGGDFSYNINDHLEDVKVIPLKHPRDIIYASPENFRKDTNTTWQSLKVLKEIL